MTIICRSCGLRDGAHEADCRKAAADDRTELQATCDHRREYGATQTTGDPPGPPCCGRCGKELEWTTVATSMDIVLTGVMADAYGRLGMVGSMTSVLDEAHDFQRFEHGAARSLKIVCRCGWASISIDRDPDEAVAVSAARDLLQEHVTAAFEHARNVRRA